MGDMSTSSDLLDFATELDRVKTGRVACFTGHRPGSFPFKYDESDERCITIKQQLRRAIDMAYRQGYRTFITGMALGVDIWAAEILLEMRANRDDIVIVGAVPCVAQESRWPEPSVKRYFNVLSRLDAWGYVSKVTFDADKGCMTARNIAMIDPSDVVIAVYNGFGHRFENGVAKAERGSGTGHAVAYALNHETKVLCYDWVNNTLGLLQAVNPSDIPY